MERGDAMRRRWTGDVAGLYYGIARLRSLGIGTVGARSGLSLYDQFIEERIDRMTATAVNYANTVRAFCFGRSRYEDNKNIP